MFGFFVTGAHVSAHVPLSRFVEVFESFKPPRKAATTESAVSVVRARRVPCRRR